MKKLGLLGSDFPYLERLCITACPEIEEIILMQAVASEYDENVSFPKLKLLQIRDLPKLKNICEAKMKCTSIEEIELWGCPLSEKQPLQTEYSHPPVLRKIKSLEKEREWWESLEWDHPSHKNLLHPFLTFEESIKVNLPISSLRGDFSRPTL